MARNVTLQDLRARVRERADQEAPVAGGNTLCTDATLNGWINDARAELDEMRIGAGDETLLATPVSFTTVSGTATYSLATIAPEFFRLWGVDVTIASGWVVTARRFTQANRNAFKVSPAVWSLGEPVYYRLKGSNSLLFIPTPAGAFTVTVHYYPCSRPLVADDDDMDGVNGWDDFVIVSAAKKAAMKEESTELVAMLEQERQALAARIRAEVGTRDQAEPEYVQDVRGWSE